MSGLSCALRDDAHPNGFVIVTGDDGLEFLMPRLISPKESDQYKDYGGIDPQHCLYIMAMDISYKFDCEDLENKFDETRKYIKTYWNIISNKKRPWFKNHYEKLAIDNQERFMKEFYNALVTDLDGYYTHCTKPLAQECKKELTKLFPHLFND